MIDVHCHILPNVDDGARDLVESLEMARAAVAEGITSIIATPHHANGKWTNEAHEVEAAVQRLNAELVEANIPLAVYPGQEVRVYPELMDDLQEGKVKPLNGGAYLLLELPTAHVPSYVEALLHECMVLGVTPIIAHPERNQELVQKPERLSEFIQLGALCQVTSHSINGVFGSKLQSLSLDWCKRNLIHLVASDAHNLQHRAFHLRDAYDRIADEVGSDYRTYYVDNAERIFYGEAISRREIVRDKKKWFKFW